MTTFIAFFWIGGIAAAYRLNRSRGVGPISSSFEALMWPAGVGYYVARRYYVNSDWSGE